MEAKADLYSPDLTDARWTRSSRSADGAAYVEMTHLGGGTVAMRDSKNPDYPALRFTAEDWTAFRAGVHGGEFA